MITQSICPAVNNKELQSQGRLQYLRKPFLCDEPTGALDKKTGTQIMELLHSVVKENGIMLLLVTHDPDIADTCDTIFEMDGGRITCAKNDT